MILYNNVQVLTDGEEIIEFSLEPHEMVFRLRPENFENGQRAVLGNVAAEDQVLFRKEFRKGTAVIYIKNEQVLAIPFAGNRNFSPREWSFAFEYEHYIEGIFLEQTNDTSVSLFTSSGKYLAALDDIAAYQSAEHIIPLDLGLATVESRFLLAGKITYGQFHTFLIYDLFRKELFTRSVQFRILDNQAELAIHLTGPDILTISNGEDTAAVEFRKGTGKGKRIFEFYQLEEHRDKHLLSALLINNTKYYLHNKQSGVFLTKGNAAEVTGYRSRLNAFFSGHHLYLYGRNTHYAYQASGDYDYLYIDGSGEPLTAFKRPFKISFFRRFGFFKVPISALETEDERPRGFHLGNDRIFLHPLKLDMNPKRDKLATLKRKNDRVILLTASKRGNLSVLTSRQPEEYTLKKRMQRRFVELKNSKRMQQLFRILFLLIGRLPKKRKLVIFESFHGKQFSDSPRAIYAYMKEHHPNYQLVWSIDKSAEKLFKDYGVPYLRRFTLQWFFNFPRAKYWVNNVRLPAWMPKPESTRYIQTWHGTPLKRLGLDIEEIHMPGTSTSVYKRNFVTESRKWDFLVSPNPYSTEIFKRAFHYAGEMIESGYPRNDVLTAASPENISRLKQKLGIPEGKKVMLYAPTWRDNEFYEKGKYKFEFQFDLDRWKQEFGDEWILLSRMHYLVAEHFDFTAYEGTIYDASLYPDICELYLISDLLITDYSSVFFDFAVLNRPIVFFMYDLEQYRDQLRGFYLDIERDAPGPIVETQQELFQALHELKDANVRTDPNFSEFREKFAVWEDGKATERVVKAFLE